MSRHFAAFRAGILSFWLADHLDTIAQLESKHHASTSVGKSHMIRRQWPFRDWPYAAKEAVLDLRSVISAILRSMPLKM
jgi:hypothetical protein